MEPNTESEAVRLLRNLVANDPWSVPDGSIYAYCDICEGENYRHKASCDWLAAKKFLEALDGTNDALKP